MGLLDDRFEHPNVLTTTVDSLFNWARRSSMWLFTYGIACCAIEMLQAGTARYDFDRYGIIPRATPRQADLMIVAGPVVDKMVPVIQRLYEQMAEPRYVIAMGSCACTGGFFRDSPNILQGVDKAIPVDIYIPGCHPRAEALLYGLLQLQEKIKEQTVVRSEVSA